MKKIKIKCIFTSVWEDDSEICTPCIYIPKTGEVIPEDSDKIPECSLVREYITINFGQPNEEELEVCPECHGYVLKNTMVPGIGKTLDEVKSCSDKECPNHA